TGRLFGYNHMQTCDYLCRSPPEEVKMEFEQLVKRLEWLYEEHKKDKRIIAALEARLATLEGNSSLLTNKNKELESEFTRLAAISSHFGEVDEIVGKVQVELGRKIEALEKKQTEIKREQSTTHRDLDALNQFMAETKTSLEALADLKKTVKARVDEDLRLAHMVNAMESRFEEIVSFNEEAHLVQSTFEEVRRQEAKRLTELQGEVNALRKRLDEQRGKQELNTDGIRKIELRLNELHTLETERRQTLNSFIEKQNLTQLDRERVWKDWQTLFDRLSKQGADFELQLQELDATHRSVKRAQEWLEEATTRFDRRVNELTEMQRLGEERFRNEWVTFKADDQRRWTNYALTQEELQRELNRQLEKHNVRLIALALSRRARHARDRYSRTR
ncbi:MAG: hypothetical protein U1B80_00430, partial [Anaerolineaceae bacterium]|nr:hypothetical protein [Anaerolineaceae bacterium]